MMFADWLHVRICWMTTVLGTILTHLSNAILREVDPSQNPRRLSDGEGDIRLFAASLPVTFDTLPPRERGEFVQLVSSYDAVLLFHPGLSFGLGACFLERALAERGFVIRESSGPLDADRTQVCFFSRRPVRSFGFEPTSSAFYLHTKRGREPRVIESEGLGAGARVCLTPGLWASTRSTGYVLEIA